MDMTHFPPTNAPLPTPEERAPQELYEEAHRNFTIGYSDVVLRDPETERFFFPTRGIEPEKGKTWFIGGRIAVGKTVEESAAQHVEHDTGLSIAAGRFTPVSHFSIAHVTDRQGQESLVRHAQNNVLVANLKPNEVEALDATVAEGKLTSEYSGGEWYDPKTSKKELPAPLKQFLRDFFDHEVKMEALQTMAIEEDKAHEIKMPPKQTTLQEIVDVIADKNLPLYEDSKEKKRQDNLYRSADPDSDRILVTSYKDGFARDDHPGCLAWVLTPKSYIPSDNTYGPNKITNYRIYATDKGLVIKKIWRAVNEEDHLEEDLAEIRSYEDVGRVAVNMMERNNDIFANDLERDKFEDEKGLRAIGEQEAQELLSLVKEWQPLPVSVEK